MIKTAHPVAAHGFEIAHTTSLTLLAMVITVMVICPLEIVLTSTDYD